jgi:hypothetical protein
MSAFGTDMRTRSINVRFWGQSGHRPDTAQCPLLTQSGHPPVAVLPYVTPAHRLNNCFGRVAGRGARAATIDAGGRLYPRRVGRCLRAVCGRPLHSVTVAHARLIKPAEIRAIDGEFRLH